MIDYDKLKYAHSLAEKLIYPLFFSVTINEDGYDFYIGNSDKDLQSMTVAESHDIDLFIAKLEELVKPEPKYEVGDIVYYLDLPVNVVHSAFIRRCDDDEYTLNIGDNGTKEYFLESDLYPTREDLIKAQIDGS